jgi:hypothetical protein
MPSATVSPGQLVAGALPLQPVSKAAIRKSQRITLGPVVIFLKIGPPDFMIAVQASPGFASRHGIVSSEIVRVAATDALEGQPTTLQKAVPLTCFRFPTLALTRALAVVHSVIP